MIQITETTGIGYTRMIGGICEIGIVRRDTGEDWNEYLTGLMREKGRVGNDEHSRR